MFSTTIIKTETFILNKKFQHHQKTINFDELNVVADFFERPIEWFLFENKEGSQNINTNKQNIAGNNNQAVAGNENQIKISGDVLNKNQDLANMLEKANDKDMVFLKQMIDSYLKTKKK